MDATTDSTPAKVYTVNGAASGSSSSLPDWLTRKKASKKGKRSVKEHYEGTINLIQEFEFPEASNRIRTTRDGHHAIATGVYKPQMRCYDLDELALKFERHTDAENVDFTILSDDWTKILLLQADRSIELHTQGGFYYRTRIPRFGRCVSYHFPSCDALIGATGSEVYRLNLDQGRFLNPLVLKGDGTQDIAGVNAIDINPAHQLLAFGVDGNGSVEFWDPRSRSRVGLLHLPQSLMSTSISVATDGLGDSRNFSVTSLASRSDGLSYAVGTSTGHTLLYDIRTSRHFTQKDLGYGLPVKNVLWIDGGGKVAGDGLVLSADRKVIKIWDRNNSSGNFASITPSYPINDVHHIAGSGMLMMANEGIQMTSYYIPQLGPAPRWCTFLDNITEELEEQTVRNVYEDYKFVERGELAKLGLDSLVGTPALKPYMHGYFVSLRLYDAARVIANPFVYEEHREKLVKDKINKLSESRIRARKEDASLPKVNRRLAEKILEEEAKKHKHEERKRERAGEGTDNNMDLDESTPTSKASKPSLLTDERFKAVFENPDFQVDENSREFALLNPSGVAQRLHGAASKSPADQDDSDASSEDDGETEESDKGESDQSEDEEFQRQVRRRQEGAERPSVRRPKVRMVDAVPRVDGRNKSSGSTSRDATFGQRKQITTSNSLRKNMPSNKPDEDMAMEYSWVPATNEKDERSTSKSSKKGGNEMRKGVEYFGLGMEKGGDDTRHREDMDENERHGRTKRRSGMRSGSKNAFRSIG
ncbi:hypothetical protein SCHPADRAFT_846182 [Schizopora paradoxa]|uniref:Uncharacterized protein n=1 Tax=Schizopora paradoxa TaxID=27342 RepID=A0A0H2SKQ5_9AGAM|nr:hypothetical protein SCHPADRAFT_846182 [Schizopora paradoxa]